MRSKPSGCGQQLVGALVGLAVIAGLAPVLGPLSIFPGIIVIIVVGFKSERGMSQEPG